MTKQSRAEALRLFKESGLFHLFHFDPGLEANIGWQDALVNLIRLARAQPQGKPVAWEWIYDSVGGAEIGKRVFTISPEPTLFLTSVCAKGPKPLIYASPPAQAVSEGFEECIRRIAKEQGLEAIAFAEKLLSAVPKPGRKV